MHAGRRAKAVGDRDTKRRNAAVTQTLPPTPRSSGWSTIRCPLSYAAPASTNALTPSRAMFSGEVSGTSTSAEPATMVSPIALPSLKSAHRADSTEEHFQ